MRVTAPALFPIVLVAEPRKMCRHVQDPISGFGNPSLPFPTTRFIRFPRLAEEPFEERYVDHADAFLRAPFLAFASAKSALSASATACGDRRALKEWTTPVRGQGACAAIMARVMWGR